MSKSRLVREVGRNYNQYIEDITGTGTVTSVGFSATMPTGLSAAISGSPITTSGTIGLTLSYAAGYAIPTTVKQSNWDDAYTFVANFPSQTGNNGKFLYTSGSVLSWQPALTNPMNDYGQMIFGGTSGVPSVVSPNFTTTRKYLQQIGNGTVPFAPSWDTIPSSDIVGQALTRVNDTNIQVTLTGTPSNSVLNAVGLTMGWTGQLAVQRGGTGASTLTGVVIGNGSANMTAVAGTASQYLRRNSTNTAYQFGTIQGGEIAGSELSFVNDANVTMSFTGSSGSVLLQPLIMNLGWSGQLSVARGGTGASTLTGLLVGNGTSAVTTVTGAANQLLRRNSTNTAFEFFFPNYIINPFLLEGQILYAGSEGTPLALNPNTTSTNKYLRSVNSGVPSWEAISGFVAGSGTINYIPKWDTTTSLTNSIMSATATLVNIGGDLQMSKSQAGSGVSLLYSANTDTTAGVTHTSRFGTQQLGGGIGRAVIYSASNTTTAARGELAILTETGGGMLANIGTTYTASDYALSLFNLSGSETIRLNTSGNSFISGGDVLFGTNGFYYDATNKRLGVGVAAPSQALDVSSNFGIAKISSSNGVNATFFQFTNLGGNFFLGQEGSSGATFGATPYASVINIPLNRNLEIFQGSFRAVQLLDSGQWRFNDYTSTTSFPGTAIGYLAFTATGDIITVPPPGGGGDSNKLYRIDFNSAMPDTWTNMPSALFFFDSSASFITAAELTNFTQVRLLINKLGTAGATNSKIYLRYSAAYTQTATNYLAIGTTSVQLAVNNQNQFLETAWIDLAAGARGDVFVALLGDGGDGAADPVFGMIAAEFR